VTSNLFTFSIESLVDPEAKESAEIINIAESIMDEVVTQLLTEDADKVLKRKRIDFVKNITRILK
jgi:hypothetical protein